jgi:hypothetical protein
MPKKIDWDSVRKDFIQENLTYKVLGERHNISRQAIEKRGADEGWQALRQTFQRQNSLMNHSETDNAKFDLDELLQKAIALSFDQLQTSEVRSFEKGVEAFCSLAETYLKIHPPTPSVSAWVDRAIDFKMDIPTLMRMIKERSFEVG